MALVKTLAVFLSLLVTGLGCELTSSQAEVTARDNLANLITQKKAQSTNTRYRLLYHVAPPIGWMNDPNGFSYFQDKYHLFYQFNPNAVQAGTIHWGHVVSTDLVVWTQQPTALLPGTEQCFSGSAIEKEGTMILMYTAHETLEGTPDHRETQYLAFSNDGIVFNKYVNNPVISERPDDAVDFRDPKVWKHGDYYYVIIGSQSPQSRGRVLLYRSSDMGNWEYMNVLAESDGTQGYMWECPDFFELDGKFVLLMSPQGIEADGDRFNNQYQTGYIIGSFNYTTGQFTQEVAFQEIDFGTDFYATQTMEKDGKRYLIAWMGMWDATHPEADDGWAGAMTIVRELSLHNNVLILSKPIEGITSLRNDPAVHSGILAPEASITTLTKTGELIVTSDWTQDIKLEFQGSEDSETTIVTVEYDLANTKVKVTRGTTIRQRTWTPVLATNRSWRIFLDASTIEVFCGEGEMVFSSRVYPNGNWVVVNKSAQDVDVTAYTLNRSVPE